MSTLRRPLEHRAKRGTVPMRYDWGPVPLTTVLAGAETIWGALHVCPGAVDAVLEPAVGVVATARAHGCNTLGDLVGSSAQRAVRAASEVHSPRTTDSIELARLHRTRNALVALRGTAMLMRNLDYRFWLDRPKNDQLAADLPALPNRCEALSIPGSENRRTPWRPLTDDEILLGHLLALVDLDEHRHGRDLYQANAYVLAVTGLHLTEITEATVESVNDQETPTSVTTSGIWDSGERQMKLSHFARIYLTRALARMNAGDGLAYGGIQPRSRSAVNSVGQVLNRFFHRAGIHGDDITPSSATLWLPSEAITSG